MTGLLSGLGLMVAACYPEPTLVEAPWWDAVACPAGFELAAMGGCESASTNEVWVPAGDFWMGCNTALDWCHLDEFPQHLVTLGAFAIDRTEVTAGQYKSCVQAGACSAPATAGSYGTYDAADKQEHPINRVNWLQARSYCEWGGKAAGEQRLCTEAEWEKAGRGGCETVDGDCRTGMRTYPWGDAAPSCRHAVIASGWAEASGSEVSGCGEGGTWAVGQLSAGASPYGALDMAGNVWEWVQDWYASDYYCEGPDAETGPICDGKPAHEEPWTSPTGPPAGFGRVVRGGSFYDYSALHHRTADRRNDLPASSTGATGFRCCRFN